MTSFGRPAFAVIYALGSAALFGLSTPFAKSLLGNVSPWLLAGLFYLASGLGLGMFRLAWRGGEAGLNRHDIPWLGAAILSGGVCGPVLLMFGLTNTPASDTALLLNLESVLTLAIAWVVFKENVDRRLFIGAVAIVVGAVVLSWPGELEAELGWGPILIAGACLAWAIDNNLTRKVSAADPVQVAMLKGLVAGTANVGIAIAVGAQMPPVGFLAGAAVVGFLGYGVSLVLFVFALRHLGTARTGAYYSLAPFIGAAAAIVMLGEQVTFPFLIGGALMAVGLWLHLTERHLHIHEHESMEHDHAHVHDEHHQHDHPFPVGPEPHSHVHQHGRLIHRHVHYPDLHHRHLH
ncbi:EamA family transporter [Dongia deserti]|uniref:EamA family transporter n=1 Tax=Dongia deserti TaxID=2268030 RepID=UPI000E65668C|nr:EamA family transporter [Dongia deserti]